MHAGDVAEQIERDVEPELSTKRDREDYSDRWRKIARRTRTKLLIGYSVERVMS
jgi:hypothetical protein